MFIQYDDNLDEYGFRCARVFISPMSTVIAEVYGEDEGELRRNLKILGWRLRYKFVHLQTCQQAELRRI